MYTRRGWSYSPPVPHNGTPSARRRSRRLARFRVHLSLGWLPRPRLPHLSLPRLRLPPLRWLLRLGPLPLAVALVGLAAWYQLLFPGFTIAGRVVDGETGQPVAGARVWTGTHDTLTATDGTYRLPGVKPPEHLSFAAGGYTGAAQRVISPYEPVSATLPPVGVEIEVADADTGNPVPSARLDVTSGATLLGDGHWRVAPVRPNATFTVQADGYLAKQAVYTQGERVLPVKLAPKLTGQVVDASTGKPVAGARVYLGDTVLTTDDQGGYQLGSRPASGRIRVLMPGYHRAEIDLAQQRDLDIRLTPNPVKALYMTYYAVGNPDFTKRMFQLLDTTELNAVVMDVKGDRGYLSYHSNVPLAQQIGANDHPTIDDLDGLLGALHSRGVYAIARIVVFKDDLLARNGAAAGADVAIKDRRDGKPWKDLEGLAWVDAFQPAAWDYNAALAREAIERGFDEVQFDYIRFPTDPAAGNSIDNSVYSKPFTEANRVDALTSFLERAHHLVNQVGGFLGIDTFGYTTYWNDDGGIGQDLSKLASHVDYLSPMVYPSTYSAGLPGAVPYPEVVARPYDVIYQSLKQAQPKVAGTHAVLRPWLQYFDDYGASGMHYGAAEVEAQKKATADSNGLGWMLWDPTNTYNRGGIAPK